MDVTDRQTDKQRTMPTLLHVASNTNVQQLNY